MRVYKLIRGDYNVRFNANFFNWNFKLGED